MSLSSVCRPYACNKWFVFMWWWCAPSIYEEFACLPNTKPNPAPHLLAVTSLMLSPHSMRSSSPATAFMAVNSSTAGVERDAAEDARLR